VAPGNSHPPAPAPPARRRRPAPRPIAAGALALAALVALGGGQASAARLLDADLSVPRAVQRDCIERPLGTRRGVVVRRATAPGLGAVTARLRGARGDWDLALFDAATGRRVAGSAASGREELAQGFVVRRTRLIAQACRRSGRVARARLTVEVEALDPGRAQRISLVRVSVPNAARRSELTALGLDLTEHGGPGFVEVVLHGADDARRLRGANFSFAEVIADLGRRSRRDRVAERRAAARAASMGARAAALPSGRGASYRRLADYSQEMKALAAGNPGLVKPITLPLATLTGYAVEGIEITTDVDRRDGKPVFLQLGGHHAREWPSSEHAMEWAHELVEGFRRGDARVRRLVSATRTIIVPVVNPEGFNVSREAASALDDGRGGDVGANLALFPYEFQRKNCRVNNPNGPDPERGDCLAQPARGDAQFGVDPNRNYGGLWGGPGATADGQAPLGDFAQDYRGNGPFSERESENIRRLISSRQVTTLITNHTFSNLVLRPPGIASQGPPPDEPIYRALGDAMAAANGYSSQPAHRLYETSGSTEDWSYYATGGLGFTFEIGARNFHPPYAQTIAEYEGTTAAAAGRGGNREAYFRAMESTANPARHSVIAGRASPGAVLRLRKRFKTATSPVRDASGVPGAPIAFEDTLDTALDVPASGVVDWHVNPSTRPIVAKSSDRRPSGSGSTESWSLTCETAGGRVLARRRLTVARGERVGVSFGAGCAAAPSCVGRGRGVRGRALGPAVLGRRRAHQRRRMRSARRLRARQGVDRYCVRGGGLLRIGYPTRGLNRRLGLGRRARGQLRGRALLALTTSRRLRVRGLGVGSPAKALRRRFRGERRLRVGRSVWYLVRGRRARHVFEVRRGRIRELGLANLRLTASRRSGARLLRGR
jgi:hypothetical protein